MSLISQHRLLFKFKITDSAAVTGSKNTVFSLRVYVLTCILRSTTCCYSRKIFVEGISQFYSRQFLPLNFNITQNIIMLLWL